MISASLLLGLGGCGSDQLAPEQENPTPVVPTPDEKGLVTLQFNVSASGYQDGVPESRGAEAPVIFTQELGDGYVLESTLTSSPKTKAADDFLREGTTVMIFTLDEDDIVTGFQVQKVGADGALSFSVPGGVTPKLVFFTLGNEAILGYEELYYMLEYNPFLEDKFPDDPVVGIFYDCKTELIPRSTGAFSIRSSSIFNPSLGDDAMLAMAGPIDADNLAAINPLIYFNHLFSRLTWNITVDASADETIGLVRAGFYPRTVRVDIYVDDYVDGTKDVSEISWPSAYYVYNNVSSYYPPVDNMFITPANWSPDVEFSQSACFMRPDAWTTDSVMKIAIDSLTINNPTGNVTYQDQEITLTGPTEFENGKEYTVNSRITKRLTWATSNIYWRGRLTFDADGGGTATNSVPRQTSGYSPHYQGVFFKWGSLVGIAPVGDAAAFSNTTMVFIPRTPTSAGYVHGYDTDSIESGTWADILGSPSGEALPRKAVLDQETNTWFGDICAYITNGVWRMPTRDELSYGSNSIAETEPAVEGWWRPNTSSWGSIAVPNDATSRFGRTPNLFSDPDNVAKLKTKWGQVITLPPSGYRDETGTAVLSGINGYYYSGSVGSNGATYRAYASFSGDSYSFMTQSISPYAMPVRCVK
jgi:hypothetical protein